MLGLEMARSYVAGDRGFGTGERFFFNTSAHLVKVIIQNRQELPSFVNYEILREEVRKNRAIIEVKIK
jgi:hypothetical protein